MRTTRGALRILTTALLVAAVRCGSIDAGSRTLPRGANPADAERYAAHDGSSAFVCDGGATTIDRSRVNDDYCDCDDGAGADLVATYFGLDFARLQHGQA